MKPRLAVVLTRVGCEGTYSLLSVEHSDGVYSPGKRGVQREPEGYSQKMNEVTSTYQEAVSSLIKLQSECQNNLPPRVLEGVKKILTDVQRRLSKVEPMLKDS